MLIGYAARNHPQQVATRGALDAVDDRRTPADLFAELSAQFGPFTLDVAASAANALCPAYYTADDDALDDANRWTGRAFCNPPYSRLSQWLAKAWQEWDSVGQDRLERLVMLVPANRSEQSWWQDYVEPHRDRDGSPLRTRYLRGRLRFDMPDDWPIPAKGNRPPFGICVLTWAAP